jgi:alpha-acetolactate decarboxylase
MRTFQTSANLILITSQSAEQEDKAMADQAQFLDGFFYRIDGGGKVSLAGMDEKTPFAAVTPFEADQSVPADSSLYQEAFYRCLSSGTSQA